MSEWRSVTIEDLALPHKSALATGPFGSAVASKNFRDSGVPMLRGSNLSDDVGVKLDERELVFLDPELAATFGRSTARKNDLVFTCWGTVGQIGLIDGDARFDEYVVSNKQMKVSPDPSKVDSLFLYYNMSQPSMIFEVQSRAIGSTIPGFNLGQLRSLTVQIPELGEQHAIAAVLRALDDKIAANTKLAAGSVRLAENLYVREALQTELGMQALGEVVTTVLGGTPSRDNESFWTGGTVPWLNSGKANEDRITQPSAYITEEALRRSAAKMMPEGTTVIAITGATLGQVSRLEIAASGNQSLVGIWSANRALNDWLYFAIRNQIPELLKKATGAAQQHVNKRDVDSLTVPIAGSKELASFSTAVTPLLNVAASADIQNIGLSATRDALLPQLMSGKLRVKDAEKVLENVGV